MKNKEKFLNLVSKDTSNTLEWAKNRQLKKKHILLSKKIAINILAHLDSLKWTQRKLAEKMGVSAQQVNKWVKGNENFTIETLMNLGEVLGRDLIQVSPLEEEIKIQERLTMSKDYEKTAKIITMSPQNFMEFEKPFKNERIAL